MIYVEFLECVARIADAMFVETEFEEQRLSWKLEHFLDQLF